MPPMTSLLAGTHATANRLSAVGTVTSDTLVVAVVPVVGLILAVLLVIPV